MGHVQDLASGSCANKQVNRMRIPYSNAAIAKCAVAEEGIERECDGAVWEMLSLSWWAIISDGNRRLFGVAIERGFQIYGRRPRLSASALANAREVSGKRGGGVWRTLARWCRDR